MPDTLNPLSDLTSPKVKKSGLSINVNSDIESGRKGPTSPLSPRAGNMDPYEANKTFDVFDLDSEKWGKDGKTIENYNKHFGEDKVQRKLWKRLQHKRVKQRMQTDEKCMRNEFKEYDEKKKLGFKIDSVKGFTSLISAAVSELVQPFILTVTLFGLSLDLLSRRMGEIQRNSSGGITDMVLLFSSGGFIQLIFFAIGSCVALIAVVRKRIEYCVREWLYYKWLQDNVIVDWQDREDLPCFPFKYIPFIKNLNWKGKKLNIIIFVLYVGFFFFNIYYTQQSILSGSHWAVSVLVLGAYVNYNTFLETAFSYFENRLVSLNDAIESANDGKTGVRLRPTDEKNKEARDNYEEHGTIMEYLYDCIVVPDHLIR
jgi:hypothetical protein